MPNSQTIEYRLHSAIRLGDLKLVEELLARGEDINLQDKEGKSPLIVAIECKHSRIVYALTSLGAKLEILDFNEDSALLWTLKSGQYDLTNFLLDFPQNLNISNKCGKTALHLAAERSLKDVLLKLLSLGANVDPVDCEGKTPLITACETGDLKIVSVLLEHKSDFNKRDLLGHCARDYALANGFIGIVSMLDDLARHGITALSTMLGNIWKTSSGQLSLSIPENKNFSSNSIIQEGSSSDIATFRAHSLITTNQPEKSSSNNKHNGSAPDHLSSETVLPTSSLPNFSNDQMFQELPVNGNSDVVQNNLTEQELKEFAYVPSKSCSFGNKINGKNSPHDTIPEFEFGYNCDPNFKKPLLPQNCLYETRKLDWKKVYRSEDKKETKLTKDERCETEFKYSKGSVIRDEKLHVSTTDLISNGIQQLFSRHFKKTHPAPDIKNFMNSMRLTPSEITAAQEWLNKEYRYGQELEADIQSLRTFLKKILVEKKFLKSTIFQLEKEVSILEEELGGRLNKKQLEEQQHEAKSLRKAILKLHSEHESILKSKELTNKSIKHELEKSNKEELKSFSIMKEMEKENDKLFQLTESFEYKAHDLSDNLFSKLNGSLKTIKKLQDLLQRTGLLLEERYKQTYEVYSHLNVQSYFISKTVYNVEVIQQCVDELIKTVKNIEVESLKLNDYSANLQAETEELVKNFDTFKNSLWEQEDFENDKKEYLLKMKQLLQHLRVSKKNVDELNKNICKLERHILSTGTIDKREEKISTQSKTEQVKDAGIWEEKMDRIIHSIERINQIMADIKEKDDEEKEFTEVTPQADDEVTSLTSRFISSHAVEGEVFTRSGMASITEVKASDSSKCVSEDRPEYQKKFKTSLSLGQQDINSVPESTLSQLGGVYSKYKLKQIDQRTISTQKL